MASKHMKRCPTSLEICKLKQADTTTNLSEWPNSKTLAAPNAGEDVEQQECSFVAGSNIKWYSHFGRLFSSFFQN